MASSILGRTDCPISCDDPVAHVKIKTDKATEAFPYIHCRGCGCQLHTKNAQQAKHLLAKARPAALSADPAPVPVPAPAVPEIAPAPPAPPAPAPRRGLFGRHA